MSLMDRLNNKVFDETTLRMLYWKLYPLIVKDFLARKDTKEMMDPKNLSAMVNAGIPVQTSGTAVSQSGATTSPGKGQVTASYKGEVPLAGAKEDEAKYTSALKTGNVSEKALGTLPE